jgi:hypothetical protein
MFVVTFLMWQLATSFAYFVVFHLGLQSDTVDPGLFEILDPDTFLKFGSGFRCKSCTNVKNRPAKHLQNDHL